MGLTTHSGLTAPQVPYGSEPWYGAYMSALFESNSAMIRDRIRLAERLIASRERDLFHSRGDGAELRALNSALLALRALAGCNKLVSPEIEFN